jgi:hypothetical protein
MARSQDEASLFRAVQEYYHGECTKYFVHSDESTKRFLPRSDSRYIVTEESIQKTQLMTLICDSADDHDRVSNRIFGKDGRAGCRMILLTIVCTGSLAMLRRFRFCTTQDDNDLPFDTQTARSLFEDEWQVFYDNQSPFAALVLQEGQHFPDKNGPQHYAEKIRMPYLSDERLQDHPERAIFKVKIAAGHFVSKAHSSALADVRRSKAWINQHTTLTAPVANRVREKGVSRATSTARFRVREGYTPPLGKRW